MILACTSPSNTIYTNMKVWKLSVQIGPTVLAGPIWPHPAGRQNRMARPGLACLANEKERALCQHWRIWPGTALMPTGRTADHRKWQHVAAMLHGRHTANHQLAVWYGCQSSCSAFRTFGILTWSRWNRQTLRFFTALHGMQTQSSDEKAVCLSVRPSVCQSKACIVTKLKKDMSRFLYHAKDHVA